MDDMDGMDAKLEAWFDRNKVTVCIAGFALLTLLSFVI